MNYDVWPGIGLSEKPVDWAKVTGSAALSSKSTAGVDRRRKTEGKDFSTFRGISRKSDELSARGAPSRMRTKREPGGILHPNSNSGKIRAALRQGPMTRAQICNAVGIKSNTISAYLHNDIVKGRILKIVKEGCLQKFALAETP